MKFRGWMMTLLVAGSTTAVAQSGLCAWAAEQYVPQLGDIMNAAQVRHQKLYFAGRAHNWELAAYQSHQLRGNLRDAAVLYPGIPIDDVTTLAKRLQTVDDAIAAKNSAQFTKAFGDLTDGCNQCHQSMERSFIVMKQPSDQVFGNQQFAPKGGR
jgi:hypothetical protein